MSGLYIVVLWTLVGLSSGLFSRLHDLETLVERARRDQSDCGLDVVFVLDGSRSIHPDNFTVEKEFVNEVIDSINVGADGSHVGIMQFSDRVSANIISLGDYVTQPGRMRDIVSNIRHHEGGETNTHEALEALRDMFLQARTDVPNVGVIITDGKSTITEQTARQAALTKEAGITLFAIGVGKEYNAQELHDIASSSQYVMEVREFRELHDHLDDLRIQLCEGCFAPMDVLFSAPDDAGIDDTTYTLTFIKQVISNLNIGPRSSQVGLTPRLREEQSGIALNDFEVVDPLEDAIDDRELETTMLSQQLQYIERTGFSRNGGGRPNAKKVAVLIVDNNSSERRRTIELANELKQSAVTLITIGVGSHYDRQELRRIASDEAYTTFYTVRLYSDLPSLSVEFAENLCESLGN